MIIPRTLSQSLLTASNHFPVLLVTGARQVGKTTLLKSLRETIHEERHYVTLDDLDDRALAKNDPTLFLQRYKPPLIIDEVQYAPELFSAIKVIVDQRAENGLFWLTGSQKFHLMHNISETLAGRVAIIDMLGLSQAELEGRGVDSAPFLPTEHWIESARKTAQPCDLQSIYHKIWRGSFPALWKQEPPFDSAVRDLFYNAYIQTYIQRDVRDLTQVGDALTFRTYLQTIAARTGQLINYADIARDVGIDSKTAKSWMSILETSGLVYLLHPYHNNVTKRLIKTPKVYFLDTGLCSYLTHWTTPETLEAGAMSGAILETYIFTEILKSYWHHGRQLPCYFYRDADQKEVDLLIEQNNQLYPAEYKKTATPSKSATTHFSALHKLDKPIAPGALICLREQDTVLPGNLFVIPVSYL